MIAALYVETGGVYFGLPDVDPWDEARDARLYAGPWPVVAHPPCQRWSILSHSLQTRYGLAVGDDGGCFAHALDCVRSFGGVLEHPALSRAWKHHGLPRPAVNGWGSSLHDPGWSTEVSQFYYGHVLRKPTWLYVCGVSPPALDWRRGSGGLFPYNEPAISEQARRRIVLPTPIAFRDVLLGMARDAA